MNDLTTMLRDQAKAGLQTQLDAAVTNGDTEAARKVMGELEKLTLSTAPKAPPYGDAEIRAELNKLPWFGTDPKKSARTTELGKSMDPKRFGSATEFAAALVKAVDDEFKPVVPAKDDEAGDDEAGDDEAGDDEGGKGGKEKPPARRASDGPGDADAGGGVRRRTSSGPWTKLSDAPSETQKEINRTADKFAPKTEDGRKKFVAKALESHYGIHQRTKGKK